MEAWIACDNSTWPASKYRLCKCHQRYIPCSTEVHPVVHPKVQHRGTSSPVQKGYLWWNLCTLYLLVCQVELPQAVQVSVVVSNVCQGLLLPFVDSNFDFVWKSPQVTPHNSCRLCSRVLRWRRLWPCAFGGVYVPCGCMHARWSYCRQFRSLLLSLLHRAQLLPFVDSDFYFEILLSLHHTALVSCVQEFYIGADYEPEDQERLKTLTIEQVCLLHLCGCLSLNRCLCCTSVCHWSGLCLSVCHWTGLFAVPFCLLVID